MQGTQFTCFTGTKVQIMTPEELQGLRARRIRRWSLRRMRLICSGEQFTCFTSTKVQILSLRLICSGTRTPCFTSFRQVALLALLVQELQASLFTCFTSTRASGKSRELARTQFTCFTGTKKYKYCHRSRNPAFYELQVISLLALLVQKYKY